MKKKTVIICVVSSIIAVLFAGIYGLQKGIECFVEHQIQKTAKNLIGYEVFVGDVSCDLKNKCVQITEVSVPNPPGYTGLSAMVVDRVILKLEPWAVFNRQIHVEELSVDGIKFFLELRKTPTSLGDIVDLFMDRNINLWALKSRKPPVRVLQSMPLTQV